MGGPQTHVTLGMTPQKTTYGDTPDCQTLQNGLQLRHEWTIDPGRRNSSRPWTATTSTASSSRIRRIYATCVVTPAATGCCCSSNDGPCSLPMAVTPNRCAKKSVARGWSFPKAVSYTHL